MMLRIGSCPAFPGHQYESAINSMSAEGDRPLDDAGAAQYWQLPGCKMSIDVARNPQADCGNWAFIHGFILERKRFHSRD